MNLEEAKKKAKLFGINLADKIEDFSFYLKSKLTNATIADQILHALNNAQSCVERAKANGEDPRLDSECVKEKQKVDELFTSKELVKAIEHDDL